MTVLIFFIKLTGMEEKSIDYQKEVERLKKNLEEEKKRTEEYLNGWKRAKADYLNLEKKMVEERREYVKMANLEFILNFLPLLDSFDKLIEHLPLEIRETDWGKGVRQFKKQLEKFLGEAGVKKIKTINEKFNPFFHDVAEKKGEGDKIIEEIAAGYLLNDEVIRPAKVIIG
ncbi:nucleotide exchange factor GrpE [bacterium (Candidatus Moisslbacteria) CG12_big_fil_rev_8_21_14_0_65_36_11]|nr:MAG: nucleotide exchange factor GrpE [Parcubacteria group bacterium CG2_30_36_38]PIV46244.1 MAG: nucleotide exchange factor GrpE [bacterium (Candidatus Moisslbacteria) CG02_land_8_20_14_3_00_36_53]PIW67928.1 MAG: nucleotide exchange factor GrpE [bacterium (Candidatus Moisslbacteria) CG12_big_fil_rev_8_21_14_0_65_36_11]PIZ90230.1 MAG: nucleotide exchange factor GrpE [bacterium (Candidatus Moisslbacteria) CG_4_10_14_0_2_um_filter_36_61]PJC00787.1 MAG: nucleotide exchange factor GrpE [bacterium